MLLALVSVNCSNKVFCLLDPFSPENEEITTYIQKNILEKSHQNFINAIKAGRGDRLSDHKDLFTGLIWLGQDAKNLLYKVAFGCLIFQVHQQHQNQT
jgi:ClpP class serine protease